MWREKSRREKMCLFKSCQCHEELVVVAIVETFDEISKDWKLRKNLVDFRCSDDLEVWTR